VTTSEIFESEARAAGDLAGVFDYDGEVAYFYLYELLGDEGQKVRAAQQILSGEPDFAASDLTVRWNSAEELVGLFIRGELWAAFHADSRASFGGNYRPGADSSVPGEIATLFVLGRGED
jgi:hypothetical protein